MDNTPFPRQSGLSGSSPNAGMAPGTDLSGMGQSGLGSSASSSSTGTHLGSGSMGSPGLSGTSGTSGASEQAQHAVDRASSTAHQTVDRVASSAGRWAERFDEQARKLTHAPLRAWETSRSSVQGHPMQAIAASLVMGFLLGRLSRSRSRHDDF